MHAVRAAEEVRVKLGFESCFALGDVVVQGELRVFRETRDGVEIRQAQEAHEEVGEVPDEGELSQAAEWITKDIKN